MNTIPRRWLGVLFSLPLAFSLLFYTQTLATEQTDVNLLATQNLVSCAERLHGLANEAQADESGFLATGDPRYLSPFQQARAILPTQIRSCDRAADGRSSALRKQVDYAAGLVQKRFAAADRVLQLQEKQGFEAASTGRENR